MTMFMAAGKLTTQVVCRGNRTNHDDTVNWTAANRGGKPGVTTPKQFHLLGAGQSGKPDAVILHSALTMFMAADKLSTQVVCRGKPDRKPSGTAPNQFHFLSAGQSGETRCRSTALCPAHAYGHRTVSCLPGEPDKLSAGQSGEIRRRSTALCPAHAYGHRTVS